MMKDWKDAKKKMTGMKKAIENDINNLYGLIELYVLAEDGFRASINDGRIVKISKEEDD